MDVEVVEVDVEVVAFVEVLYMVAVVEAPRILPYHYAMLNALARGTNH